jgi:hypothetical protein
VYGGLFVQNNPVEINVTIVIGNGYLNNWYFPGAGFEIDPINAIEVIQVWTGQGGFVYEPVSTTMYSTLTAYWKTSDLWTNTWEIQRLDRT